MPEDNRVIYISRTTNIGEKYKLVRVMARLNRAVWKNVHEAEAMYALRLFLIAREIGELEIAEESTKILHDLLSRIRHSLERTTLKGIYSHDNFIDVIGGMEGLAFSAPQTGVRTRPLLQYPSQISRNIC